MGADVGRGDDTDALDVSVEQVVDYAIISLDPQGVIRSWNAGAQQLKGYTAGEAIGEHSSMFYPAEDREAGLPDQLLERARADGHVTYTGWRVRKDGSQFWGDVVITAVRSGAGEVTGYVKIVQDVSDRHEAQAALRESEERFRLLVSQVVDYAIISLDPQGVIRSWNAGAQQLKGYTAGEAIGEHFSMFYPAEDREAGLPDQLLERARADGHVTYTGWRVRKDGSQFWGDVVISAVHDDRGRLSGFGKVTRDRSDAKRVEELRDALYRGITHDLRTPISAIGGFATLVRDAQPEELADLSHRILENTRTLSTLVDQLLEYVRLRTGNVQLDVAPADVRGAIEDTVAQLGPVLADHEVTIAGAEAKAAADPGALRRILTNLLANAAQYSPAGTSVTATIIEHEDTVEVTISDEGRGIAREDIRSIFDEFERGQLRRDRKGIGLGLSIVRHLVHLQDGRVWLDSEPGVGTTVGFELPRQRS